MIIKKQMIFATVVALAIAGQVQANICTKISTCARNAATGVTNFVTSQAARFSNSRVAHLLVPRDVETYKYSDLYILRFNTEEYNRLQRETGYRSLKFGESEKIQYGSDHTFDRRRLDTRTVYNYRRLLAVGSCIGGLATLFATYQLGKKTGKKDGYNAGSKELWDSIVAHYDINTARPLVQPAHSTVSIAPLAAARGRKLREETSSLSK